MSKTNIEWSSFEHNVIACKLCPRLVQWREEVARVKRRAYRNWDYWGKPVPGFGDRAARILIVGLAPGAHGSNRTGRMFTGDSSGEFLYSALFDAGFANQPESNNRQDGLKLQDVFVSAICRCVPPGNKPVATEIGNCLPFLEKEIELLEHLVEIVVLGRIAFDNVLRLYRQAGYEIPRLKFVHGETYDLGEELPWLIASYHPSRQNTQTGRLTKEMFAEVWLQARNLLSACKRE